MFKLFFELIYCIISLLCLYIFEHFTKRSMLLQDHDFDLVQMFVLSDVGEYHCII